MGRARGHYLNPEALDAYMRQTGLSLTTVAGDAGMELGSLSGLMRQHRLASAPTAHKLAGATGIPVGVLFPTISNRWLPARALHEVRL